MNWVEESAKELPEDESPEPAVAELDELQTYVGRKTDKSWVWTASDHYLPGILAIQIGYGSGQSFDKLWKKIKS